MNTSAARSEAVARARWLAMVPLAVALGGLVLVHRYFWTRLFETPAWGEPVATAGTAALVTLAAAIPLGALAWRVWPGRAAAGLAWVGFGWLGVLLYVLLGLLVTEPWAASAARETALGVLGTAGAIGAFGLWSAARAPVVVAVRAEITDLPAGFEGFRIAVVSDIHIGPTLGAEFAREVADRVNQLEADMIAVLGDVVDGTVAALGERVAPLAGLSARDGVFFVTGNHEYYVDAGAWRDHWRDQGWRVLENAHVTLFRGDDALVVAGVEDPSARHFGGVADVARAVAGAPPGPIVLLAHRPSDARKAAQLGIDLVLAGHTHGGQLLPLQVLWRMAHPLVRGTRRLGPAGKTLTWVGQGTGYWGAPLRVGTQAEIGLVTLTRKCA